MVMMQTTVMLGLIEDKKDPDASAHDKAIHTYKETMKIEAQAVLLAMISSLIFGWLYEAFTRRCVLITCFVLLAVSMSLPYAVELGDYSITITRVTVCVLVQAIL